MLKFSCIPLAFVAILAGCGSSSSDAPATTPVDKSPHQGVFLGDDAFLIVSSLVPNGIVAGSFDLTETYSALSTSYSTNSVTIKGVRDLDDFMGYPDINLTFHYSDDYNQVDVRETVNDKPFVYSFDRIDEQSTIAEIAGTYTSQDDGSLWQINDDGSFSVIGDCAFDGKIESQAAAFYLINFDATSCQETNYNGEYSGFALVVNINGQRTLYSLGLKGETEIVYGFVELN